MFLDKIKFDLVMISPWLNHDLSIIQAWLELDLILNLSQYDLGIFGIAWEILNGLIRDNWTKMGLTEWVSEWLECQVLERLAPLKIELFIPIGFPRAWYWCPMEPFWAHEEVSVTPFGPGWNTKRPLMTPFGIFWSHVAPFGLHMLL